MVRPSTVTGFVTTCPFVRKELSKVLCMRRLTKFSTSGQLALTGAIFPDNDPFATVVDYRGAFGNSENWALGWTAMDEYGYFGNLRTTDTYDFGRNAEGLILMTPYPNPAYGESVTIDFALPKPSEVNFMVFDMTGRLLENGKLGRFQSGNSQFNLNIADYPNGMYIIALDTEMGGVTQKFTVYNRRR